MTADAAAAWAAALDGWRIPDEILAAAPEPPWQMPPSLFPFDGGAAMTPTHSRVAEALPVAGTLLDVGAGGGAASLPLAARAAQIVAVDESAGMLERFAEAATRAGAVHSEVVGEWPRASATIEKADVVVCANVVYNVADIVPFVAALASHARRRVVLEATTEHPLAATASLWNHFHPTAPRLTGPAFANLLAVLAEMNLPCQHEFFTRHRSGNVPRADIVAFVRRRMCVSVARDAEIDAWLGGDHMLGAGTMAAVWWDV